ncbi:YuzF family protein [Rossellomorea sp. DUT-2]|uniref:YuzF family protein n=1 Tax=Rossellomorea sp. DUT-2 TaxID=3412021 RepID=UPI003D178BAD
MDIQMSTLTDPYLYQALMSMMDEYLVVQTSEGSVRGKLASVLPDHIVIEVSGTPFYVRSQQIVWFFPSSEDADR